MAIVEVLNGIGVSLSANAGSTKTVQSVGGYLTIAAISIQLVMIVIFLYFAVIFQRRCASKAISSPAVKTLLVTLYASMTLIFVRCIYRLVEHAGHSNAELDNMETLRELSPLLRYEAFFYVFEGTLMLINSALWNVFHPGRFLPRDYHIHLGRDGMEVCGEEDSDERPLLAKTANVLSFGLLFRRKRQTQRFEELPEYPTSR